jgi:hypothetical protein
MTRARDVATQGGLVLITNATATSTASITINNCFSATYDNYLIVYNGNGANTNTVLNAALTSGGTPNSSNYYYAFMGLSSGGATSNLIGNPASNLAVTDLAGSEPNQISFVMNVHKPFLARHTTFEIVSSNSNGSIYTGRSGAGLHYVSSSYDGIIFGPPSPNTFSGNFKIYGYRNA